MSPAAVVCDKPQWPVFNAEHRLAAGCVGAWPMASLGRTGAVAYAPPNDADFSGSQCQWVATSGPNRFMVDRGMATQLFLAASTNFSKIANKAPIDIGAVGQSYTVCILFRTQGTQTASAGLLIKLDTAGGKHPFNLQIFNQFCNFSFNDGAGHTPNPVIATAINDDQIHRFVAVRDTNVAKVTTYLDGVEGAQAADTTNASCANGEAVYIAGGRGGLGPFYNGFVYELRILLGAWTPGMVAEDFLDPFAIYRGSSTDYLAKLRGRGSAKVKSSNQGAFPGNPSTYNPQLNFARAL